MCQNSFTLLVSYHMKHAVIVYIITTIKELERKLFFEYNYSAYLVHETGFEVQQLFITDISL